MSDSLRPHELQHARPPCLSPTPGVHSNSRPSSQWCHPAISSSVVPFSSCPQSLPASESFPMSQLFAWGGQSTGLSALASFLPKNTQGWCFNYRFIKFQGRTLRKNKKSPQDVRFFHFMINLTGRIYHAEIVEVIIQRFKIESTEIHYVRYLSPSEIYKH